MVLRLTGENGQIFWSHLFKIQLDIHLVICQSGTQFLFIFCFNVFVCYPSIVNYVGKSNQKQQIQPPSQSVPHESGIGIYIVTGEGRRDRGMG